MLHICPEEVPTRALQKLSVLVVTLAFNVATALPQSSCTGFRCPEGQRCELQTVACLVAPCLQEPTCVDKNAVPVLPCPLGQSYIYETANCTQPPCIPKQVCKADNDFQTNCTRVFCKKDAHCEIMRGVPVCVKRIDLPLTGHTKEAREAMPPTVTCATLGCAPGENCVQKKHGPQCEPVDCGYYAYYDRCFDGCEATCENFGPNCPAKCGPGGCRCKMGYYRYPSGACAMECPMHR